MNFLLQKASAFFPYTPVRADFQAAGSPAVSTNGTVSPAWPTHQVNDLALLIVESQNEAITLSTPSGFQELPVSPQVAGAATKLAVFWARATSASMAAPVVAAVTDHLNAQIVTFRNIKATFAPWDVLAGGFEDTSDTSLSISPVTTTKGNCLIVYIASTGVDVGTPQWSGETNASLDNLTERVDQNDTSGSGGGFGVWTGNKVAAGSTGTFTATAANATPKAFVTIALQIADEAVVPYEYCWFWISADANVSFEDKDGNSSSLVALKAGEQSFMVKRITQISTGSVRLLANSELG